jgi:hypothetical protein
VVDSSPIPIEVSAIVPKHMKACMCFPLIFSPLAVEITENKQKEGMNVFLSMVFILQFNIQKPYQNTKTYVGMRMMLFYFFLPSSSKYIFPHPMLLNFQKNMSNKKGV